MRSVTIFLATFLTCSLLAYIHIDFNYYIVRPDGLTLKSRATEAGRFFGSIAIGGAYGALNTILILAVEKARTKKRE